MRFAICLYLFIACQITLIHPPIIAQAQLGNEFVGQPNLGIRDAKLSPDGLTMAILIKDIIINRNVISVYAWDGAAWQEQGDRIVFPSGWFAFNFSQDGQYLVVAHSGIMGNLQSNITIQTLWWDELGYSISNTIHTDLSRLYLSEVHFHFDAQDPKIVLGLYGAGNHGSSIHTFIYDQSGPFIGWGAPASITLGNSSFFDAARTTLSADGNRMSFYSESIDDGSLLEVYDWVDGAWEPLPGQLPSIVIANDVCLSGDGQRLAISYADDFDQDGSVIVYDRQGQDWVQLGEPILNPIPGWYDILGGLSFSGEYLWCGKLFNNPFSGHPIATGCMQLFRFDEDDWSPFGDVVCGDIENEYGSAIASISSGGLRTLMGADGNPNSDALLGRVRTFDFTNVFPGNDKPVNAFDVFCGQTVNGTTNWAELEGGGPVTCAEIAADEANVWYRYQGAGNWVTASLCGTDWDSRISVFFQDGANLVCVGANDDYDCDEDGNWFEEENAQFQFFGEQGETYFLMIQEKPGEGGDFDLSLSCEEMTCIIPFNQRCATSTAVPGDAQLIDVAVNCQMTRGDNSCGSWATELGPCVFPGFAFQDQWFRFTTDADPTVRYQLFSQGIQNAVTNIYDGCGGEVLQCLVGEVDEELEALSPFTNYYIQVLSLTDRTGAFDICVSNCNSPVTYYPDFDGDGYGDDNAAEELCTTIPPPEMILQGGDCLDFHINAHEGMEEICDGWDNDCDGIVDNFCKDHVPGLLRVDGPVSIGDCSGTSFSQSTGSGEWIYLLSAYGGAVAAFQDLEAMGTVEYSYRVDANPGRYWNLDDQGLPDEVVASRDINISVQFPPQREIPVRLFYLKTEIEAFQVAAQQALFLEEPALEGNFNLTKVPAMGCPDGNLPMTPELIPIMSQGGSVNGHYLETKVSSFSRFFLHVNKFSVLPVEIEAIELSKAGTTNELDWWVTAEEDLSHYEIERSQDGQRFLSIGQQVAANRSSYKFVDQQPKVAAYYRIKAVDFDGQFQYSKLLFLQREEAKVEWKVFPNPATRQAKIVSSHAGEIGVYNAMGQLRKTLSLSVGTNPIDVGEFPAGVYFLRPMRVLFGHDSANGQPSQSYESRPVRLVVKSH